ncbi:MULTISPECIES: cellulase family glycosylhydrolase [unclassified Fibrobacter]|uniref:cellulase family glycosylhydrolase n=1 Tax=unclassified Fibrobacter TaxID=2634177 RepID=UPI000D6C68F8|nr:MULTISPECIES: cellulase family glycosylhydrolase [unclassified Fibrobacter]PWJ61613.1 putative secreted protein (Por secretion system target) [Fibrobacter sp. UWR4]PZW73989.1 putative secreted protein (Por secretion system target) [Fibrobacter sp. UWR1]
MKKLMFGLMFAGALTTAAFADLPTAAQVQKNMGMGYNIGNSMEVPNNPTGWGNPYPTQALLDSIKAAGFNTVRIPCAWDSHTQNGKITETWLDSVKTVVDYALRNELYVVLNIHHEGEGGWFQTKMATTKNTTVDNKMKTYWTQIANKFKNYDEHLLFAGANEPGEGQQGLTWTSQHAQVLMGYYQTFIDAVRATGGNNATRTLIIQGLQTDIDKSVEFAPTSIFPKDKVTGRLMFEVHFYGPYQYVLMTSSQNWGCPNGDIQVQYYYGDYQKASDPKHNAGYNCWANSIDKDQAGIGFPNAQFAKMKSNYVDKGYPVIIGEFGSLYRSPELSGSDLELHRQGRIQWHKDVVTAAKNYGLTPIVWDMGNEGASYDNMAYIRRQTNKFGGPMGKVVEPEIINAMRGVYGLGTYVNKGVTHNESLIPGNTPIQNSSSSVASSSSVQQPVQSSSSSVNSWQPQSSSSSVNPWQPQSSSSSVNPWQPQSSSSSNQATCDALTPECGYTHEALCSMGITEYCMPVVPVNSSSSFDPGMGINESQVAKVTLSRQGNMIVSQGHNASIKLFDMNGNLIRQVSALSDRAIMSLAGIQSGLYIAKSGAQTLKVNIR